MVAKLKGNFFVLLRVALLSQYRRKKAVNLVHTLSFSRWTGEFWIQEVITARFDTFLRLSSINEVVSRRCRLRKRGD